MEWLIQLAEGLSGAVGVVLFIYAIGAWFAFLDRKAERDYAEPDELEQAKEWFALNGSRQAYDKMLSLVRPEPGTLQWWNTAEPETSDWPEDVASARATAGYLDAVYTATKPERVGFPALPGALVPRTLCDCNACRISRREFPSYPLPRDLDYLREVRHGPIRYLRRESARRLRLAYQ